MTQEQKVFWKCPGCEQAYELTPDLMEREKRYHRDCSSGVRRRAHPTGTRGGRFGHFPPSLFRDGTRMEAQCRRP
jgi:hypothetical protein